MFRQVSSAIFKCILSLAQQNTRKHWQYKLPCNCKHAAVCQNQAGICPMLPASGKYRAWPMMACSRGMLDDELAPLGVRPSAALWRSIPERVRLVQTFCMRISWCLTDRACAKEINLLHDLLRHDIWTCWITGQEHNFSNNLSPVTHRSLVCSTVQIPSHTLHSASDKCRAWKGAEQSSRSRTRRIWREQFTNYIR